MTGTPSRARTRQAHQVGLPARRAAIEILYRVLSEGRPLDTTLADSAESGLMTGLTQKDRAFARNLVSTTLRRKGQIDPLIMQFSDKPLDRKRTGSVYEAILTGATQILFLRVPTHAAIDLAVRAVTTDRRGGRKLGGFVNALLRRVSREGPDLVAAQDASRLSVPGWLYESWTKFYGGPGAKAIAEAQLTEPPLDLTVISNRGDWAKRLDAVPVGPVSLRLSEGGRIENLEGYAEGAWWVQDVAATLPALLLGDLTGKTVFDLCAAPGGKTAQLAASGAKVTAVDASATRLERLKQNLERLKLNATCIQADVLEMPETEPADAVLLDAPCSATGTIRRHPDIPHVKNKGDLKSLVGLQAKLLHKAVRLVKPGGLLVYCTCSLQPEEGERQVAKLLAQDRSLERLPVTADDRLGLPDAITADGDLRTLPSHIPGVPGGMDGFFACRIKR
ncbi:MAG: methyltransferase domain-containing protein [Alphaproteobacteria bacterium]|nr:methyltransferase domain-containing protein [Alphaproteobacteria bacterium]